MPTPAPPAPPRGRRYWNDASKLIVTASVTTFLVVMCSVSLWLLPALGRLANPSGWLWESARYTDLPAYEEVEIEGLVGQNVTVLRDDYGVPHIYAERWEDLFFAFGYCQAQDRFFEMTLFKLAGWGRLSEVIGEYGVEIDQYLRTISIWRAAEDMIRVADENRAAFPRAYGILDYFTRGVNAWRDTHRHQLPVEFALLDLPVERWEMVDTAVMAALAGLMLSWIPTDLEMEEVRARLTPYLANHTATYGPTAFADLFPGWNATFPYETPIIPDNRTIFPATGGPGAGGETVGALGAVPATSRALANLDRQVLSVLGLAREADAIGSNNWVIDGNLSATGTPILCGDPHLVFLTPSIWYEAHLVCPDPGFTVATEPESGRTCTFPSGYNVYGVCFPGVPVILIGHNAHCAWSETNVGSDSFVDYYQETLNPTATAYFFNGSWHDVEIVDMPIRVKDGEFTRELPFQIRYTRHGPLISDALFGSSALTDTAGELGLNTFTPANLSVKWIGYNNSAHYNQLVAMDLLNRASNLTAVKFALDAYPNPPQNFVVADAAGNIGMISAGLFPVRAQNGVVDPAFTGRYVQPGDGTGQEWVGFVPPEHLPHSFNPPQHYLASANQRTIAARDYNYSIGSTWAPGWRGRVINQYLDTTRPDSPFHGRTISAADMRAMQYSSYDLGAQEFLPLLLAAIDGLPPASRQVWSAEVEGAVAVLRAWNQPGPDQYRMERHLVAPTIFDAWMDLLPDCVWADEWTAAGLTNGYPHAQILEALLKTGPADSPWFDNVSTPAVTETKTTVLLRALELAVHDLSARYGPLAADPGNWLWGNHHKFAAIGVPLLFNVLLDRDTNTLPIPGSGRTINNAHTMRVEFDLGPLHVDLSDLVFAGASWRQVVDLGNVNASVGIYPGGQRENIASQHYFDQAPLWAEGNYKPLHFYPSPASFVDGYHESTLIFRRGN